MYIYGCTLIAIVVVVAVISIVVDFFRFKTVIVMLEKKQTKKTTVSCVIGRLDAAMVPREFLEDGMRNVSQRERCGR